MRVLPVIDLLGGQVVRGVAGERQHYRPIRSRLAADATPAAAGAALARLGLRAVYVADLDAIGGAPPNEAAYRELAAQGLRLLVDAGLTDVARAVWLQRLLEVHQAVDGIVAALETLPGPHLLSELLDAIGPEQLVFSLDLKAGRPLGGPAQWQEWSARRIATAALDVGVRRLIVLDLAQVGMGHGVSTLGLCRELRSADPDLEIITGGGVRSSDDLRELAESGVSTALVASAIHDGRIGPEELAPFLES
jgi:phosphoribosylformimino-5-aminoimidazole carboxamide ribotide isomerase